MLTDASGDYTFTNVANNHYFIIEADLANYISTNDSDGGTDQTTYNEIAINVTGNIIDKNFFDKLSSSADLSLTKTVSLLR